MLDSEDARAGYKSRCQKIIFKKSNNNNDEYNFAEQKRAQLQASRRRRLSSQLASFDVTDLEAHRKKHSKKSKWPFKKKSKVDHSPHDVSFPSCNRRNRSFV